MRVGILGGGQLGAMLAEAVQALGAEVRIYDPDADAPAVRSFSGSVVGAWSDVERLRAFADDCDVVTYEVEHVDAGALQAAGLRPTPSLAVLEVAQDRAREKCFLRDGGFPHVGFAEASIDDARARAASFGFPFFLKAARGGYDGKGQWRVDDQSSLERALAEARDLGCERFVLEDPVELLAEASCIVARDASGESVSFPVFENHHRAQVLDWTVVPARFSPRVLSALQLIARDIAGALDVVGLLTVEFFLASRRAPRSSSEPVDGLYLYVNELAPRPHNSGHVTRRACTSSQFDALARVLVGAPLAHPSLLTPTAVAMANLLGDAVRPPIDYQALSRSPDVLELRVYGKSRAAPRRKMGHVIARGESAEDAVATAVGVRERLAESARRAAEDAEEEPVVDG